MNIKNVVKAVAIITIFSVITRILGFLFRIYLSWELGAEMLGVYQVAFSILGVLMTVVGSGLPLALSKQTAIYTASGEQKRVWGSTTATLLVSLVVAGLLTFLVFAFKNIIAGLFTDKRCMLILLVMLPSVFVSVFHTTLRGTLWGQKKFFWVGFTEFLEQVVRIAMFFVLAYWLTKQFDETVNAGLSLSLGCLVSSLIVLVCYFAVGNKLGNPKREYEKILKSATPVTGVRVATSLMAPVIAILIPLLLVAGGQSNESAMSDFGVAVGMTMPLLYLPSTLVGSLATVLLPELSGAMQSKDYESARTQVKSAVVFSIFISTLIVPLYMGMSQDIGLFIYNNAQSGEFLFWSAWLMIPLALSNITSTILNAMGMEAKSFKNYIVGGVLLLVVCVVSTLLIGIYSLIAGTGVCMIVVSFLNMRMIKKQIHIENFMLLSCVKLAFIAIPATFLTYFCFGILDLYVPKFFALALSSIVGALAFMALCMVFRVFNVARIIVEFKKNNKPKMQHNFSNVSSLSSKKDAKSQ